MTKYILHFMKHVIVILKQSFNEHGKSSLFLKYKLKRKEENIFIENDVLMKKKEI